MDWLRLYHELPSDPKMRVVARRAGRPTGEVVSVWIYLLCAGSPASPRWQVARMMTDEGAEEIAAAYDYEIDDVRAILAAIKARSLVDADGFIVAGQRRNPRREDDSRERVRAFRERKRNEAPPPNGGGRDRNASTENETETSRAVTQRNADVTSREDKRREDSLSGADAPDSSDCPAATPSTPLKPRDLYPELGRLPMVGKRYVYPDEFERFWRIWRGALNANDSKDAAYSAWRKPLVKGTADPDDLVAGAERHATSDTVANGFRCLTSTWISRSGWTASYEPTHRPEQSHLRVVAGGNRRPAGSITAAADDILARIRR